MNEGRTTVVVDGPELLSLLIRLERSKHIPGYGDVCPECNEDPLNSSREPACRLAKWIEKLHPVFGADVPPREG